jgi:hypothetical protein
MAAASAQYVVDVAVSMPEGAATAAQLDTLSKKLLASGANADNFHDAIALASNALAAAKAASLSANEALSAGNAAYKDLEQAALQAAKAEEKASKAGFVPTEVHASAIAAAANINAYAVTLAKLEANAASATAAHAKLSAQLGQVQRASEQGMHALEEQGRAQAEANKSARELRAGLDTIGGPVGDIGKKVLEVSEGFHKLTESVGSGSAGLIAAAGGIASLGVAVVAFTALVVASTIALAAWAIGLANTNREEALTVEATEVLNPALTKLHGTISDLTDQTGLTETAIDGIAESLQKAHVAAANMPAALKAASLAEAALGQGGAQQFIERMQASTQSVQSFSNTVSNELGSVVAEKLLGLDAQATTFHDNIKHLFGDLNIDPALKGLQKLVDLFDENTAAGAAMQTIFEGVFQPLINGAETAATVVEAFVLGFLIGLVKLYINLKPAIKAVTQFFGFHDSSLATTCALVTKAAEYIVPAVVAAVAAFGAFVAVAGIVIGVVTAIVSAIFVLPYALIAAGAALSGTFTDAWHAVTAFLSSIDLSAIGTGIMQGLANGIAAAAKLPLDAITGAVGGVINAAKHLLDSHSPSRVFGSLGVDTVTGYAQGVDATAQVAQSSVEAAIAPPSSAGQSALAQQTTQGSPRAFGGAGSGSSTSTSTSASKSVSLTGPFNFYGVEGAEDAERRFGEMLTRAIEGDATQIGASPDQASAA